MSEGEDVGKFKAVPVTLKALLLGHLNKISAVTTSHNDLNPGVESISEVYARSIGVLEDSLFPFFDDEVRKGIAEAKKEGDRTKSMRAKYRALMCLMQRLRILEI